MDAVSFLAIVLGAAPPLLFAVIGETIAERAGVINLSLDGTILLAAMAAFAAALATGCPLAGIAAGMAVGMAVSGLIAFTGIALRQSQVATGFVLALLARDLAYVLGNSVAHQPAGAVLIPPVAVPLLTDIPVVGAIFFRQNLFVYLALLAVVCCWAFFYRTRMGLALRAVGERAEAAYARGLNVARWQYAAALTGGALVGLGGASFSLLVKPGWSRPYGVEGIGWIALAIVIFGNWHPLRAAL
ncbi:MAG TPA: ABC transporter permease, partial [bacterium]|nr:ABC transporter permease [bacterium]